MRVCKQMVQHLEQHPELQGHINIAEWARVSQVEYSIRGLMIAGDSEATTAAPARRHDSSNPPTPHSGVATRPARCYNPDQGPHPVTTSTKACTLLKPQVIPNSSHQGPRPARCYNRDQGLHAVTTYNPNHGPLNPRTKRRPSGNQGPYVDTRCTNDLHRKRFRSIGTNPFHTTR